MNNLPPATALILVGVMKAARDLEIARLLGWYRIPLRFAPKIVDVDYLAFYQTSAFGDDHGGRIEYIAPVRGHELTTRAEILRDEPDHPRAREEYYKISIGALQKLPQPIMAHNWKRITFLYTTGELLNTAASMNDLIVQSEGRTVLWQSLREKAIQAGHATSDDLPNLELDPILLAMLGKLDSFK